MGEAAYERASAHDCEGREAEAIPHYREAIELGLGDDDLAGALLGLRSSLRHVGEAGEAVEVLAGACARFPENAALPAFYALALWSAGRQPEAVRTLLDALIRFGPSEVAGYERALRLYTEELA
jgi:tetratricopeptide (TPR) repeat protein